MKNIVYNIFSQGTFVDQIRYSLQSAYRLLPPERSDFRLIVYCVSAKDFEGLHVETVEYG